MNFVYIVVLGKITKLNATIYGVDCSVLCEISLIILD